MRSIERANLHVFQPFVITLLSQPPSEFLQDLRVVHEGLAVIREREGDQAITNDRTSHPTKNDTIGKRLIWWRDRQYNRLVVIGTREGFEPTALVKRRRAWVTIDQIVPARVRQRVRDIQSQSIATSSALGIDNRTLFHNRFVVNLFRFVNHNVAAFI